MTHLLTSDKRTQLRHEMDQALEDCLATKPRLVGFLLFSLDQDEGYVGGASGVIGNARRTEMLAALLAKTLEFCERHGMSPELAVKTLNFGASLMRAADSDDVGDKDSASGVRQ